MMIKLNNSNFGFFLGILSVVAVCLCSCGRNTEVFLLESEQSVPQREEHGMCETSETDLEQASVSALCVYVCGAVNEPGVYTLPAGGRVCDAIEAAGGFKKNASTDYWNQAEYVTDGQMIDVPTKKELAQEENFTSQAAVGTDQKGSESGGKDSAGDSAQAGGNGGAQTQDRIDINSATREQLMQIPGVGETRADNIIRYRETAGGFSKIEDIMNVTGIKEGLFEKMKDYIRTGS